MIALELVLDTPPQHKHMGIKDIKDKTKNNFVIKINQLYEYLLLILKLKNTVRVDTDLEIRVFLKNNLNNLTNICLNYLVSN